MFNFIHHNNRVQKSTLIYFLMKKNILLLVIVLISNNSFAQLTVSTNPENKKALLEEITGIYCSTCPDGHLIAENIKNTYGSNFWIMNIHGGAFAIPTAGDPDYRSPFGAALIGQSNLTGYPAGTVNRHVFNGLSQSTGTAMGRANWSNATTQILGDSAYVNIAVEAQVDQQTRQLRVITQYYYTGNGAPINNLNVALLQNNIEGPQTGALTNSSSIMPNGLYQHQHMLRHLLTGQWGLTIPSTSVGSTVTDTFNYTVPVTINNIPLELGNLEILAFITEGQQEVINVAGTKVSVVNHAVILDGALVQNEPIDDYCGNSNTISPWIKLKNTGATPLTSVMITYSVNGGTPANYTWNGNLDYSQVAYAFLPTINFTPTTNNLFNVTISSVNGTADSITNNNSLADAFNLAPETNKPNITIKITLDGYGDEISWTLKNSTGSIVASNPVYVSQNNTSTNPQPDINLFLPNDCYTFQINDSYGDGMCCASGNGSYEILADSVQIPGVTGSQFTYSEVKKFEVNVTTTSNVELIRNNIKILPNPCSGELNLNFENNVKNATIRISDMQGETVISENISQVNQHKINLSELSNGIYTVIIDSDGKTNSEKLVILK